MNRQQREFERRRLELFERYGAEMEPLWATDRQNRRTCLLDSGGGGTPLLMVHGGGSNAAEWAPIAGSLAEERRVLVVDRPGFGLSYPMDYEGVDVRKSASEWLTDLLDDLGLDAVDVAANSMGAYFTLSYMLSDEELHHVRRLVLLGAPAGVDRWIPYQLRILGTKGLNRIAFALAGTPDIDSIRQFHEQLLVAHPEALDDEYLDVAARAARLPRARMAWRTLLEECVSLAGFRPRYMIRDEVPSIETPTLFLWGEQDAYALPESGAELARKMTSGKIERVRAAGHLPWLDRPERVTDSIESFLEPSKTEKSKPEATKRPRRRDPQSSGKTKRTKRDRP